MLPSDVNREVILHDEPFHITPAAEAHGVSGSVHLPPLGYKRCTTCRQRRAIKGGSQKGGRFICLACLDSHSL